MKKSTTERRRLEEARQEREENDRIIGWNIARREREKKKWAEKIKERKKFKGE